jgi:serine/threonine protein kinase
MADRAGQQFGNYRLVHLLGEGGFAEVYLGEHLYLQSEAALKVLHTRLGKDDQDTFLEEARVIVRLRHPNIVRLLEFGIEGGTPYLVMDYAPHGTLRDRHPRGALVPLAAVVSYAGQVAEALQYAHDRQLIHRDVKPENMLLGEEDEILLTDFGIVTIAQNSRLQQTEGVAGTAAYMAPEQLQGKPRPASDQYALGVSVYEWLTGTPPFHGSLYEIASQHILVPPPPLRQNVPTLSPAVEEVVLTALAKDHHQRFASVRAFARALEEAGTKGDEPPARAPGRHEQSTAGRQGSQRYSTMPGTPTQITPAAPERDPTPALAGGPLPEDWKQQQPRGPERGSNVLSGSPSSRASLWKGKKGAAFLGAPGGFLSILLVLAIAVSALLYGSTHLFQPQAPRANQTQTAAASLPTLTPKAGYMVFPDQQLGISLQYAKSWQEHSDQDKSDPGYRGDLFQEGSTTGFEVGSSPQYAGLIPLQIDDYVLANPFPLTGISSIQSSVPASPTIHLDNQDWTAEDADVVTSGGTLHMTCLASIHHGHGYVLFYFSQQEAFSNDYARFFQPMLLSFRFLGT